MANGMIYIPVEANTANGIMTMDTSGGTQGGYWLEWTHEGYTGISWFWDDPNNYLKQGWENAVQISGGFINSCPGNLDGTPHTVSEKDFLYHISQGHTSDLDDILGAWSDNDKMSFVLTNGPQLSSKNCVTSVSL